MRCLFAILMAGKFEFFRDRLDYVSKPVIEALFYELINMSGRAYGDEREAPFAMFADNAV